MTLPLVRSSVRSGLYHASRSLGTILISVALLSGCSKKEESTSSSTQSATQTSTGGAIELVSHAPEQSFLLVAYNGESEGGKRSYTESLKTVRRFITAETEPRAAEEAQESAKAPVKKAAGAPRSLETIQQELAELLETSGFLAHESGSTLPYREVVLFAAAGNDDVLVNGGLCASGPDFSKKLDTLIAAARTRGYEVADETFGSSKGYAVTTVVETSPAKKTGRADRSMTSDAELEEGTAAEAPAAEAPATESTKGKRATVYLGSSPEGIIGVGSHPGAVAQCLHPDKKALPPIVTSSTIKRIVDRHPDTGDDFLRVYFDLDLFKRALESKRDALEKLLGETDPKTVTKPIATACGPEEACQAPSGATARSKNDAPSEDVASRLPSLQDSINKIGQLPSRTFLAKGSFDAKNAVTMRLVTLLEKEHLQAAPIFKSLEDSTFPRALASIPSDAAIQLGVHYPIEKALPLIPLLENSPWAPLKSIRSLALAVVGLPTGSLAPELGVVVESNTPAELSKLIKATVAPFLQRGGLPVDSWQNKQVEGVPTSFILSPFGFGLFLAEPTGALVVGTTETGIARLIATHKSASPEKAAESLMVSRGAHAPFAARVDAVQLAKMVRGLQGTLAMMMPKEAGSIDSAQIDQLQGLGTMYLALEFDKGFTELVWRKIPSPTAPAAPNP